MSQCKIGSPFSNFKILGHHLCYCLFSHLQNSTDASSYQCFLHNLSHTWHLFIPFYHLISSSCDCLLDYNSGFHKVWDYQRGSIASLPTSLLFFPLVNTLYCQSCLTLRDLKTIALQAPLSMEISRQEFWSGLPFPFPGHLPDPEIELGSPTLQADSL